MMKKTDKWKKNNITLSREVMNLRRGKDDAKVR